VGGLGRPYRNFTEIKMTDVSPFALGRVEDAWSITPSDSAPLTPRPRGLYVAAEGLVQMRFRAGGPIVPIFLAAGMPHPISPYQIMSTDTAATGIVGVI
jgi:hypothetical protein